VKKLTHNGPILQSMFFCKFASLLNSKNVHAIYLCIEKLFVKKIKKDCVERPQSILNHPIYRYADRTAKYNCIPTSIKYRLQTMIAMSNK